MLTNTPLVTDTDTETNYPAWYYCKNYGNDTSKVPVDAKSDFKTGWYLPSIAELFEIWSAGSTNSGAIAIALGSAGGNTAPTSSYWSSSQVDSSANVAHTLFLFYDGTMSGTSKSYDISYVCAVRVFTY